MNAPTFWIAWLFHPSLLCKKSLVGDHPRLPERHIQRKEYRVETIVNGNIKGILVNIDHIQILFSALTSLTGPGSRVPSFMEAVFRDKLGDCS